MPIDPSKHRAGHDAATQAAVHDAPSARALMLDQPSIIKRPVVDWQGTLTVGFTPELFQGAHASLRDRA